MPFHYRIYSNLDREIEIKVFRMKTVLCFIQFYIVTYGSEEYSKKLLERKLRKETRTKLKVES